nr:hypothetical protein [Tanacetum cinerariifolium]
ISQSPTVDPEQGFEKSALEILKIKREQAEMQKIPKFTIKSTDKAALQEKQWIREWLIQFKMTIENIMMMKTMMMKTLQLDQTKVRRPRGEELNSLSLLRSHPPPRKPKSSEPKMPKTPNTKWFTQPPRPSTPDLEWNKHQVVFDQPEQPWFNSMVSAIKDPLTFNDLMAISIDFSKYVLNRLKIDNLTQDILLGPAYNLLKGTCSSNIELEYHFQECFNALTDRLNWNNPKGDRYPFDLSKPLPLQGHPCHLTVAADYFFNNDLEYLKSSDSERTYTLSITKTKAARYDIKGIEDMVPRL